MTWTLVDSRSVGITDEDKRAWFDWFFMTYLNGKADWEVVKGTISADDYYGYTHTFTGALGDTVARGVCEIEAAANDVNNYLWQGGADPTTNLGNQWVSDSTFGMLNYNLIQTIEVWESDEGNGSFFVRRKESPLNSIYMFMFPDRDSFIAPTTKAGDKTYGYCFFNDLPYHITETTANSFGSGTLSVQNHYLYMGPLPTWVGNFYFVSNSNQYWVYSGKGGDIFTRRENNNSATGIYDSASTLSVKKIGDKFFFDLNDTGQNSLMLDTGAVDPNL